MPRGGARKNAGRLAGGKNTKTKQLAEEALKQGLSPLQAALQIVRDPKAPVEHRMRMIEVSMPYCHPKIAAVTPPEPQRAPSTLSVHIISIPNGRFLSPEEQAAYFRPSIELLPEPIEAEPAIEVEAEPMPEHYSILD